MQSQHALLNPCHKKCKVYVGHNVMPHLGKCMCGKWQHTQNVILFSPRFHRLTLSCLSVPLIHGGKDLGHGPFQSENIFSALYLDNKLNKWGIFKILVQNVFSG